MAYTQRTKEIWTGNCDDALNFPIERWNKKAEEFLKEWAEFFGDDYETEKQDRQNRVNDNIALGIVDKVYPMNYLENFLFIESLKRLAMTGKIKRIKAGWRVSA